MAVVMMALGVLFGVLSFWHKWTPIGFLLLILMNLFGFIGITLLEYKK